MTSRMLYLTRTLCLTLAAGFYIATATAQSPQSPPAAAEPAAIEEELEEVVVRGRNLADAIVKAEEEYYKIFNDVNKDDRYDTHCVFLQLDGDSRMQSRVCMPGFVADAMAAWAPFKARCKPPEGNNYGPYDAEFSCLDRNRDGRLSFEEAQAREELGGQFSDFDTDQNFELSYEEFPKDLAAGNVYMPPPPQMVLMEGTKKWYDHMMKVTNSDPRLMKMADNLGGLYQELAATQKTFERLDAAAKTKSLNRNAGPRR